MSTNDRSSAEWRVKTAPCEGNFEYTHVPRVRCRYARRQEHRRFIAIFVYCSLPSLSFPTVLTLSFHLTHAQHLPSRLSSYRIQPLVFRLSPLLLSTYISFTTLTASVVTSLLKTRRLDLFSRVHSYTASCILISYFVTSLFPTTLTFSFFDLHSSGVSVFLTYLPTDVLIPSRASLLSYVYQYKAVVRDEVQGSTTPPP